MHVWWTDGCAHVCFCFCTFRFRWTRNAVCADQIAIGSTLLLSARGGIWMSVTAMSRWVLMLTQFGKPCGNSCRCSGGSPSRETPVHVGRICIFWIWACDAGCSQRQFAQEDWRRTFAAIVPVPTCINSSLLGFAEPLDECFLLMCNAQRTHFPAMDKLANKARIVSIRAIPLWPKADEFGPTYLKVYGTVAMWLNL